MVKFVLAYPRRRFLKAMKYWWPTRLTLKKNSRVHAFLWWNFTYGDWKKETVK